MFDIAFTETEISTAEVEISTPSGISFTSQKVLQVKHIEDVGKVDRFKMCRNQKCKKKVWMSEVDKAFIKLLHAAIATGRAYLLYY